MSGTPFESRGLSQHEAEKRLREFGANRLPREAPTPILQRFVAAIRAPLVLLLLGALAIDLVAWAADGAREVPVEAIAIGLIVLLNGILEVVQGSRAERALAALEDLATPTIHVWRDGALVEQPADQIVPGDLLQLEAGARVPADGAFVDASGVRLDTSALTGESVPEPRTSGDSVEAGSILVAGHAKLRVTATGASSAMGKLATLLSGIDRSPTPLQRRLAAFGKRVAQGSLILAATLVSIGLALGGNLVETLLLAVALTVAAVPEGLPAVVTGALALGTQRMARRNAIVRRLAAVETLGSVTLIASDKTGTLTRNRMHLAGMDAPSLDAPAEVGAVELTSPQGRAVLRAALLASDAVVNGHVTDPMERALVDAVRGMGDDPLAVRQEAERHSNRPFDATWAFVRVSVAEPSGQIVSYLKGAPEALLARCALDAVEHDSWAARTTQRAEAGSRTLLVARGEGETEDGLEPLGLLVFRDPPREGAADAVASIQHAGARLIMVTGDHPSTANAIAAEVGMPTRRVALGEEVDGLIAAGELEQVDVFARTAPERKLALVEAYQAAGHTVAMTGDGVNDGPALRRANVGVAMGDRGSDVAREAADIVLLDDDIATLVAAIEEGRGVAANLRAFIRFLFAANLAEVLTVAVGFGIALAAHASAENGGFEPPLTAAQILWINLVTDALPALALALDRRPGVMQDPPRSADRPLLAGSTLPFVLGGGVVVAMLSLGPMLWVPWLGFAPGVSGTVTFMVLVLGQLALIDGARRERYVPAPNRMLVAAVTSSVLLQLAAVAFAPVRALLGLAVLPAGAWPGVLVSVLIAWLAGRATAQLRGRHAESA